MLVGEKIELLDDLSELQKTANNIFKSKVHVLSTSELNIEKVYEIISSK
tara:strand:- start:30 stop:176 length:147 start_codon:yes stop_codon:yes gene_type:complete